MRGRNELGTTAGGGKGERDEGARYDVYDTNVEILSFWAWKLVAKGDGGLELPQDESKFSSLPPCDGYLLSCGGSSSMVKWHDPMGGV